jgi:hypothetical protein
VEDFTPPTIKQIEECLHFMEEANENGKVTMEQSFLEQHKGTKI